MAREFVSPSKLPSVLREFRSEFVLLAFGLFAINAIFVAKAFRQSTTVDPVLASQLGSFVGGYVGPIFSLVGVLLLLRTLKEQRISSTQQTFETKYFELLKMHRANLAEIQLQGNHGRRVFVLLFREFRAALSIVRRIAEDRQQKVTNDELVTAAYYCTFYGVGPTSSRMLRISLSNFDKSFVAEIEKDLNRRDTKERVKRDFDLTYEPFDGHQSRLGHYYRHLYQLVKFVADQPDELKIDKYDHVKTIRAQLSTHEQALLLVNSRTPVGRNWWLNDFILKYRLVQNVPHYFFDPATEIDMNSIFKPGYFEWEES